MRTLLTSLSFLLFCFTLIGQDYNKFGIETESGSNLVPLAIGTEAPNFNGTDQFGQNISLREMNQDGPVLVIFYRGYWCGICKKSLTEFQDEFSSLSSAGVQIIAVAPEVQSNIEKTVEQGSLEFTVISDSNNKIMKDYHVAFDVTKDYQDKVIKYFSTTLEEINGQDSAVLPIPATYLVGADGKIKYVHFDINYRNRASVSDILAKL